MSQREPFLLEGPTPLHGEVDLPAQPGPRPTVVICHGFKGFFEWGFFPPLATLLAERGLTVVRFNYSGSGMKPGDERVSDIDAFRRDTHSLELEETLRVLAAVGEQIAPGRVDRARIGLLGHSRGGGAAILASAHAAWRDRLRVLVSWAAVSTFDRYVEAAAGRITAPWLIVHGADDESVPAAEARTLDAAATGPHELLVIPGGNHTFGARHPFAGPTPALIAAMNATQTWLRRHLGS